MTVRTTTTRGLADIFADLVGQDVPVAFRAFDGSYAGPADPVATIEVRSPAAVRRVLAAPNQLGLARGYVAGEIELHGDIFAVLGLRDRVTQALRQPQTWVTWARLTGSGGLHRAPEPPPEEVRVTGRRHSRSRDAAAIAYHYDVPGDFYRLFLGATMTYSCGVWADPSVGLDAAQEAKYELICRKLGLAPGMRLLDVGCGWGGMVMHAARRHGVRAVGVTLSQEQAELARRRVADAGLSGQVEIRLADYRDVSDGPYDAISSIGMFEHVGTAHLGEYFGHMRELLAPGARLLNHGISSPAGQRPMRRNGFVQRYVFPDGELQEIGRVVSAVQHAGLEVRHTENLREHYALTLRTWVRNLEEHYDEATRLAGAGRARVWRLYLAGSAVGFERGDIEIHQTLAVRADDGVSRMPRRPDWD
ncbi:SAM-dependent methyltransferase [Georgenia muralis]|uniref:Cyclopropane-fatty-acyl-phospholipid synthase n=1 Tax=Georgenia muralis TaxID=154117 RepID=A0A3N4Z7H7_9MICO|nr:cyclopropane-fatty-acyl-phospholipid synthase family protein [Georgenia muralis]RPF28257.1 cyclopropane-fatty-acyl-phospholipid synthase [Georgenia muralis]